MTIGMIDLQRQRQVLEPGLSKAIGSVLEHGGFVGGPEVTALEAALAERAGVNHVIGCANGTDALQLLLRAGGIGPGDCVFVPSLTFAATAGAVVLAGAVPVFVDVRQDTGTLCRRSLADAVGMIAKHGRLTPRAVIAVDLYGMPADYTELPAYCRAHSLMLFYDAAHSIGTITPAGPCGSFGDGAATSFYPSKALGCYGDGGAVFTNDPTFAARVRSVANHGVPAQGSGHAIPGTNSRLDSLQAAVLLEKLRVFDREVTQRRDIAARYSAALHPPCMPPHVPRGVAPVWSYYALRHPQRDRLKAYLEARGIRPAAHYTNPLHQHAAFAACPIAPDGLAETEALARLLLCIPLHPYLEAEETEKVAGALAAFDAKQAPRYKTV